MLAQQVTWSELDGFALLEHHILSQGQHIATWHEIGADGISTDCRLVADVYWIMRDDIGAVRFEESNRNIAFFPASGSDVEQGRFWINHSWLPLIYQTWGWQVLHASAALHIPSQSVVAFTGTRGAGKSTFAYGLGLRQDWQQIADDTLAFSADGQQITLLDLPNAVRLRPQTAQFYEQEAYSHDPIMWPEIAPTLQRVFFLEAGLNERSSVAISAMDKQTTYLALIQNACYLTTTLKHHNQRLLSDYLVLAQAVSGSKLTYRKGFNVLDSVLDAIIKTHPNIGHKDRRNRPE